MSKTSIEITYLCIKKNEISIIEGISSPQYRYLSFLKKLLCFLIELMCISNNTLPKNNVILTQMFPNFREQYLESPQLIRVKRNEKNNITYSRLSFDIIDLCKRMWRDQDNRSY